jgi:hypothetical protein
MDQILTASAELISGDDSGEMVKQARVLAQYTALLIQAIKAEAELHPDKDLHVSMTL